MFNINPKFIEGATFSVKNSSDWTCVGTAKNETFLIVGAQWDQARNRTTIKTFKLSEVQFKGKLPGMI
jgi:hypothetical protein